MNKPEVFKNTEFGAVRVVMISETPWFVGKDESPELIYNLLKYELVFNLKK